MGRKDPDHWLYRFTPREWIRAALGELARAEQALARGDRKGGLAGCRRAAGMALNGALAVDDEPDPSYGRTYVDHVAALERDERAPAEARAAASALLHTPLPGGQIVLLRTTSADARIVEATKTVMAHAYALVLRGEPAPEPDPSDMPN